MVTLLLTMCLEFRKLSYKRIKYQKRILSDDSCLRLLYRSVMICTTGERLSLLVVRTTPALGNVTVDWTLEGPFLQRTFSKTSGTLFFTKVNTKIEIMKEFFVAS